MKLTGGNWGGGGCRSLKEPSLGVRGAGLHSRACPSLSTWGPPLWFLSFKAPPPTSFLINHHPGNQCLLSSRVLFKLVISNLLMSHLNNELTTNPLGQHRPFHRGTTHVPWALTSLVFHHPLYRWHSAGVVDGDFSTLHIKVEVTLQT